MFKTNKRIINHIIAVILLMVSLSACAQKGKVIAGDKTMNIGSIGNKITVDGTVAYVAGENAILVPYDFSGDFTACSNVAYSKSLKGCENPRLPSNETDDLPEEVSREIISFYGDIGGCWTSLAADHTSIEIVGQEPKSVHYAGVMKNYFSVGNDGVADTVYGYCLDGTDDTTTMGLLVLYDITDEFDFIDVEDTADSNYSTKPIYENDNPQQNNTNSSYNKSPSANTNIQSSNNSFSINESSQQTSEANSHVMPSLPKGEYKLTHIFSPFVGWIKIVDSIGNYNDSWKEEEVARIRKSWDGWQDKETIENDVLKHRKALERIGSNMHINVTDKWMRCYNIYNDLDLCKASIDDCRVYDTNSELYGHSYDSYNNKVDSSMGIWQPLDAEIYELKQDGLAYDTFWGYDFMYYPNVNGIGINVAGCNYNYEMLFTLEK